MASFIRTIVLAGSLAATGCMTHTRPLDRYERHEIHHVRPAIDDDSELSRYFLQEDRPHLGTEGTHRIEGALHVLLEDAFTASLGERVNFAPIHYQSPGYTLQVARRGELAIISARILYGQDLSLQEREALEMLVDSVGPGINDVRLDSEDFRELVGLLEQRDFALPPQRVSAQHAIDAYFAGQEPQYAGYMMTMGGFALDFLLCHYIRIEPDQTSLHGWVALLAHEIGHTLIFLDANLSYKEQLLAGYLNWSDNDDIVTIQETACNIISDRITPVFFERHVDPDSDIYRAFAQRDDAGLRFGWVMRGIIAHYTNLPVHDRITRRDELFESYRAQLQGAGFSSRQINEAYLALQNRYSGGNHVQERLDAIADSVGLRDFIHIVPYLYTQDDLRIVYERVQDGIRGREIIVPIEHAHDTVNLGSHSGVPF